MDGPALIGSVFSGPEIEQLLITYFPNTPIVASDTVLSLPNTYLVLLNHYSGIKHAVTHLVEKGHKKISFVYCRDSYNTKRKITAFKQARKRITYG